MEREITSLSDAVRELDALECEFFDREEVSPHRFPFGIWFRGHSRTVPELQPRAFRKCLPPPREGEEGCWDESNVYDHLKLLAPNHEHTYRTAFDWLCLMQHYSVPTRLLDWSESILSALYFAVKDEPKEAGELVVLNAKRLNFRSKGRFTISTPEDGHVVIRAEMATTRSLTRLRARKVIDTAVRQDPLELAGDWMERCLRPIAVFPRRLNERMILQTSVFTLHGGKIYSDAMAAHYKDDRIPAPISLDKVDEEDPSQPILKRYRIPAGLKDKILTELFRLGVHEAMLFREIDRQANYLERLWWYGK